MSIQNFRGKGILWGIPSVYTSGSMTISCSFQNQDFSDAIKETYVEDCNGQPAAMITTPDWTTVTADYVFIAGTNTGTASVNAPQPGDVVTIASGSITGIDGNYMVTARSIKSTNNGATIVSLTLKKHPNFTM